MTDLAALALITLFAIGWGFIVLGLLEIGTEKGWR